MLDPVNLSVYLSSFNILLLLGAILALTFLEVGFSRYQNLKPLLLRNATLAFMGISLYLLIGRHWMYPEGQWLIDKRLGFAFDSALGNPLSLLTTPVPVLLSFIVQGLLSSFTALIACLGVAERAKTSSLLIFSGFLIAFLHPVLSSWYWGDGWLATLDFHDAGGAMLIHAIGGWSACAGILIIGARSGKYSHGSVQAFPHANPLLILLGFCMLCVNWSALTFHHVAVVTPHKLITYLTLLYQSVSLGFVGALLTSLVCYKKIKLAVLVYGTLGSLVAVSAGIDVLSIFPLIIIALTAGILLPLFQLILEHFLKIDDPVGIIAIHLLGGIGGTLAIGLFSYHHTVVGQLVGVAAYAVGAFLPALIVLTVIEAIWGLRVPRTVELKTHTSTENLLENQPPSP